MTKKRFQRKCQEMIDYEDRTFEDLKLFAASLNKELSVFDCEIVVTRRWVNYDYDADRGLQDERIEFLNGYACLFSAQFQKKGMDPDDETGEGFQFMKYATAYGRMGIYKHWFMKNSLKYIYKKLPKVSHEIMEHGLHEVAKKYLAKVKY